MQWNGQRQLFVGEKGACVIVKQGDVWIYKTAWLKNDNDEEFDKNIKEEHSREKLLSSVDFEKDFVVYYQAKVDIRTEKIIQKNKEHSI